MVGLTSPSETRIFVDSPSARKLTWSRTVRVPPSRRGLGRSNGSQQYAVRLVEGGRVLRVRAVRSQEQTR